MPELDDDKTDKLFQVGADRHDFTYDPAAWEQMEGLLDADDLRRQRINWLLALGGLLLLLALAFAWFNVGGSPVSEELTPAPAQAGAPVEPTSSEAVVPATALTTQQTAGKETVLEPQLPAAGADNDLPENPQESSKASRNRSQQLQEPGEPDVRQQVQAEVPEIMAENATESGRETILAEQVNTSVTEEQQVAILEEITGQQTSLTVSQLSWQHIDAVDYTDEREAVTVQPADEVPTFEAIGNNAGFAVGVSAGFASGTTKTGSLSAPRLRFGGRLDYRLNNHFSLGTGVFLTKIDYKSNGKEYKADENFWLYDIVPEKVEADCDILEIPLSLTWHPHGNNQSGFYLGAGLTSYFMLTEKFAFKYDVPDDDLIKGWREDNTNQHLLGMGQINFGFQRKASRRTALQVESFLQLPLTGIGHGGVNLMTIGASVNYTFDFRKRH